MNISSRLVMSLLLLVEVCPSQAQQHGWVQVAQFGNPYNYLETVEFTDSLKGLIGGPVGSFLYRTTDGGVSWTPSIGQPMPTFSVSMYDSLVGWAAGSQAANSTTYRTTDGGATWTVLRYSPSRFYRGTASLSSMKNYTAGYTTHGGARDTAILVCTTDGGLTWAEQIVDTSIQRFTKIQFVDSLNGWVLSDDSSIILHTSDGGGTWVHLSPPSHMRAAFFCSALVGFAISGYPSTGTAAYCYRTTDAGNSWEQLGELRDSMWGAFGVTAVSFTDSLWGWAFGSAGQTISNNRAAIFRTTDGGLSWILEYVTTSQRFFRDGMMLNRFAGWGVGGDYGGVVFAYRLVTDVPLEQAPLPPDFELYQNFPNPFNAGTTIDFALPRTSFVSANIYDVLGREVSTLASRLYTAGTHRLYWHANEISSGTYFYRFQTNEAVRVRKFLLLK